MIQGPKHNRRPDVVVHLNGLRVVVVELKNHADEKVDVRAALTNFRPARTTSQTCSAPAC